MDDLVAALNGGAAGILSNRDDDAVPRVVPDRKHFEGVSRHSHMSC